ncbi:hypothetical protein DRJ22_01255 [Candidatus Woesearchaeota archaeon]|nr:MAG: hypothetical protein B6U93_04485 [Candidatus Woesearchaeota archaeon ex4484_78]RLE46722.1 MAG: hypothetical protein DRJ22_01255 [Candidatus Woesearchaeota archaeon]
MKGTKILALLMAVLVLSISVSAIRPDVAIPDFKLTGKAAERGDIEKPIVKAAKKIRVKKMTLVESRKKLKEIRQELKTAKMHWLEAKKQYIASKDPEDLKKAVEKGKEILALHAEKIVDHLTALKARIEANKNIEENLKTAIIADIDDRITAIEQKKLETDEITTKEKLREVSKEIKEERKNTLPLLRRIIGLVKSARVKAIINKAEKVKAKITTRIEKLKEQGIDTTGIEESLQEYSAKIDQAKTNFADIKAKYLEIKTKEDVKKTLREINDKLKEANKNIREAYKSLKNAVKELRQSKLKELKEKKLKRLKEKETKPEETEPISEA